MPGAVTTYEAISPRTKGIAKARLLKNAKAVMLIEKFGMIDPIPRNSTLTAIYRRYLPFPLATAPLAEGVTPTGSQLQYEDVRVQLQQYGDVVRFSDIVKDTHEDPVLNGAIIPEQSKQAAETIETIRYHVLRAGTYATYAGGTTRATVNATVGKGDIKKIVRSLKRNRAQKITKILRASANIATDPIMPAFVGLSHTDLEADLSAVAGFIDIAHYAKPDEMEGEYGKIDEVRFATSDLFKPFETAGTSSTTWLSGGVAVTSAAAADVYPVLILGADAYGMVPFAGSKAVEMYVKNPEPTETDPLAQRGFSSWKTLQGTLITTQAWIHRYEVAATANPSNS